MTVRPKVEPCPKCGVGEMDSLTYWQGGADILCRPCERAGEHLHVACSTCAYETGRPCADAKPAEVEVAPV